MRTLGLISVLIMCMVGSANAFVDQWDVPYWKGDTESNPYTDSDSNVWGVYLVAPPDPSAPANYIPMIWNGAGDGGAGLWQKAEGAHPGYWREGQNVLTASGYGSGAWNDGALTFTPATAGPYSWYGELEYLDWSQSYASSAQFGVMTAGGVYTALYDLAMTDPSTFDLGAIPELQDVALAAGDRLTVRLRSHWWGAAAMYFGPGSGDGPVGIGLVPEPATIAILLGGAVLGLIRRRK